MQKLPTEIKIDGCYGICCNKHANCQLYENVNKSRPYDTFIIGSCNLGMKDHPKFVPLQPVGK